jgi:hypothetical protein
MMREYTIGEAAAAINLGLLFGGFCVILTTHIPTSFSNLLGFSPPVQITLPLLQAVVLVGFLREHNTAATWYAHSSRGLE